MMDEDKHSESGLRYFPHEEVETKTELNDERI